MAALTPKARSLVQAGRAAFRPAAGDRARVAAALGARLGTGALPADAPPSPGAAPPAVAGGLSLAPGLTIGACLLAGAAVVATWAWSGTEQKPPEPGATVTAPAALPASPPPSSPSLEEAPATAAEPVAPRPPAAATETHGTVPSRGRDRLAEEVLLLSRATSALRAGRANDALQVLDEHQRRFPNGALREERRAARAQALCASKRVAEGRAELAHLAPGSPAAVRARQICDAAATK